MPGGIACPPRSCQGAKLLSAPHRIQKAALAEKRHHGEDAPRAQKLLGVGPEAQPLLGVGPSSRAQEQAEHPEHESCSCFRCCLSRAQSTEDPSSGTVLVDGDYRCDFQARR